MNRCLIHYMPSSHVANMAQHQFSDVSQIIKVISTTHEGEITEILEDVHKPDSQQDSLFTDVTQVATDQFAAHHRMFGHMELDFDNNPMLQTLPFLPGRENKRLIIVYKTEGKWWIFETRYDQNNWWVNELSFTGIDAVIKNSSLAMGTLKPVECGTFVGKVLELGLVSDALRTETMLWYLAAKDIRARPW